jgi:hypothetical protein
LAVIVASGCRCCKDTARKLFLGRRSMNEEAAESLKRTEDEKLQGDES